MIHGIETALGHQKDASASGTDAGFTERKALPVTTTTEVDGEINFLLVGTTDDVCENLDPRRSQRSLMRICSVVGEFGGGGSSFKRMNPGRKEEIWQ